MKRALSILGGLLLGSALAISLAGCKAQTVNPPTAPIAGAYNSTDQTIYTALVAAQASLQSLKASVPANPALKPYVNQAILDYNIADVAWQTYHTALASNPGASSVQAQASLTAVQTDIQKAAAVTK